jgi:predicted HNH restriction endonuclease
LPITLEKTADVERAMQVLRYAHSIKLTGTGTGRVKKRQQDDETLAIQLPENITFPEGGRRTIVINAFERNKQARKACLKYFGARCIVCGFDFECQYGEIGKGFIHVHHIVQLSTIRQAYKVNPIEDLRPVCPNCHEMLHRTQPAMSIDELGVLLRRFRTPDDE